MERAAAILPAYMVEIRAPVSGSGASTKCVVFTENPLATSYQEGKRTLIFTEATSGSGSKKKLPITLKMRIGAYVHPLSRIFPTPEQISYCA
ncbi:hypothetical protein D915_005659 [Fasciola hepatica]|uniref:Uncharacterized protein n=1 Tax=Fasciola hepatica TaxID=6192 RepID=A0A4E0RT27_FASHE|nr:hypothetical protein D915_005659 [Fasciola hepatica]